MQMLAFYFSSLILAQNNIKRKCHSTWVISDLLVVNPLLTEEKADFCGHAPQALQVR